MDPFVKSTETPEIRSLRAMRKAAWAIFIFQLIFLLILMAREWGAIMAGTGLTIATAIYALVFTGLMLDILLKPVEQLNYRATEKRLVITIVFFCMPAICMAYYWFITVYPR